MYGRAPSLIIYPVKRSIVVLRLSCQRIYMTSILLVYLGNDWRKCLNLTNVFLKTGTSLANLQISLPVLALKPRVPY